MFERLVLKRAIGNRKISLFVPEGMHIQAGQLEHRLFRRIQDTPNNVDEDWISEPRDIMAGPALRKDGRQSIEWLQGWLRGTHHAQENPKAELYVRDPRRVVRLPPEVEHFQHHYLYGQLIRTRTLYFCQWARNLPRRSTERQVHEFWKDCNKTW